ncbi:LruC domain-containing protein [Bacteroides sp. GD17]|uniref:LruC domain-containing protein n=1 Tax=Bacteroides sp. GD17 TaxID=3139826 RepID=UPI0025CFECCC|nr:LruC domain-containing protein [uncultured Bacteroides sp.]
MERKHLQNILTGAFMMMFISLVVGCTEKDLYDPSKGKEPLPDESEYFGFETKKVSNLYVDYNAPGFKAWIAVYSENPMNSDGSKREDIEPFFTSYTDGNGKFEGNMEISTAVKTVYLYTDTWGLPRCIELDVENGAVRLDLSKSSKPETRAVTRAYGFTGDAPYLIEKSQNLYSLCKWGDGGNLSYRWDLGNINEGYITNASTVGQESMDDFAKRMKAFLASKKNQDNSALVKQSGTTNITIKNAPAKLDVVFVNRDAEWDNTFGYYYYKTDEAGKVDVKTIKKYIVFPNVELFSQAIWENILHSGDKVRLKFYDQNGNSSDEFPVGYTVGWFIYAQGFQFNQISGGDHSNDNMINTSKLIASNLNGSSVSDQRFITIKDQKSGNVIIGVEDGGNKSYCDLLFYVNATPESSIENPDRPVIPDPDTPPVQEDKTQSNKGTLAFEDIWPSGGDYDMNDVIVEYKRTVYYNTDNVVTKIEDIFRPTHDGADYINAFAYQIDVAQFGQVTLSSDESTVESATSSIIVYANNKTSIGKEYTIIREFPNGGFDKKDIKDYNPYIIVNYASENKQRTEVHLPKFKATSYADPSQIGTKDDAYYIDRKGTYPFAIDLFDVTGFHAVTETYRIDSEKEYPEFKMWTESKGTTNTDWYNHYKGGK